MLKRSLCSAVTLASIALSTSSFADEKLVLYTSQPNSDAQQTVDAFQAAYPDIEVEWVRDGTTRLMTRLRSELAAGVSNPDVLLIADSMTMTSLKQEGHLQPYLSPERDAYDEALYDPEGYFYGTKLITTGIVYNTGAEQQPKRWEDLTGSEYEGLVTMPSPLYSGAALIHMAAIAENPALGLEYYEALQANRTEAQGGNGGVFNAVAAGTKPYGIVVDFLPIREAAKGSPVAFVFPEEGVSAVTEPVAIMQEAENLDAAQKFVDFVLSQEGQTLVSQQGYLPAHPDVTPPEGFPERSSIDLMPVDIEQALEQEETLKQRFSDLFGG
ncbi:MULTISPECIES: ABC transporter substrate-binding protein [Halomonadaceae]|uniref:ABC transporter substrate-binding protein n=1 Tax=Vreelandella piezotolerans TaxID=2609667 RepID=A0ABQ6XA16_9GAMM|nr:MULTISPECIES: ABC transporter substrate-binding protein [Halomonas]KAE8438846.1 ABC transporter substrate-binding protein [Halomonas piezotolerans]KFC51040.1 ABC transporter substrate-binding protein [Halomonas sp. SUBG004]QJA25359.1 ABC transporter substrate-binding protein [Halomonas piezotolerans]TNH18562.1 ABC transporter substrate-binding protein [Halomonas sp. BL6]